MQCGLSAGFLLLMERLLNRIVGGQPVRTERGADGSLEVYPLPGHEEQFNAVARELVTLSGEEFVALPRPAGPHHYDQVVILPIDS